MNTDEFLEAVLGLISTNKRLPHGLKVSTLGMLTRRAFPTEHWTAFGFPTLKTLLLELERRGKVKLSKDEKDALTVSTLHDSQSLPAVAASTKNNAVRPFIMPIRRDVWTAFAINAFSGGRFINRETGEVRMGVEVQPDASQPWIEVHAIPEGKQKGWAQEFLSEKEIATPSSLLNDPAWYTKLADYLRQEDVKLLGEWNRRRSLKVSEIVRNWCTLHHVDVGLISDRVVPPAASARSKYGECQGVRVRQVVLKALERMSTEELIQLPIPAKYLLKETGH